MYAVKTITKFYFIYMIYRLNRLLLRIFVDFELSFQHSSVVYKASGRRRITLFTGFRRKCTLKAIDNAYRGQTRRNLRVFTKNSIS